MQLSILKRMAEVDESGNEVPGEGNPYESVSSLFWNKRVIYVETSWKDLGKQVLLKTRASSGEELNKDPKSMKCFMMCPAIPLAGGRTLELKKEYTIVDMIDAAGWVDLSDDGTLKHLVIKVNMYPTGSLHRMDSKRLTKDKKCNSENYVPEVQVYCRCTFHIISISTLSTTIWTRTRSGKNIWRRFYHSDIGV